MLAETRMKTVTIAHRDSVFAEHLARELRSGGYRVIIRTGPFAPGVRCKACSKADCPLTEPADLLICDPHLRSMGTDDLAVVEAASSHPGLPILLAWSPRSVPDVGTLRAIRMLAPAVRIAAPESAALMRQVDGLLTAASAGKGKSNESARHR
jgi:hypothetical protein